jgi:protein-histidine pros-kinase
MKLIFKFNLVFALVFGAGLAIEYYFAHDLLQRNAQREIQDRARLMMQTTLAVRDYTVQEISPLLIRRERNSLLFIPQTVPAFAATEIFRNLQRHNPDYNYKEATLNPTNLRDRATDWESDVINRFRSRQAHKELFGERDTPSGKSLYFARPITIQDEACLE